MGEGLRIALVGFSPYAALGSVLERQSRQSAQELYILSDVSQTPCVFGLANLIIGDAEGFCALPPDTMCGWVREATASWMLFTDQEIDHGLRYFMAGLGVVVVRPQLPAGLPLGATGTAPLPSSAAAEINVDHDEGCLRLGLNHHHLSKAELEVASVLLSRPGEVVTHAYLARLAGLPHDKRYLERMVLRVRQALLGVGATGHRLAKVPPTGWVWLPTA